MVHCICPMRIFSPTETDSSERRVAIVPASVMKLTTLGAQVAVEAKKLWERAFAWRRDFKVGRCASAAAG